MKDLRGPTEEAAKADGTAEDAAAAMRALDRLLIKNTVYEDIQMYLSPVGGYEQWKLHMPGVRLWQIGWGSVALVTLIWGREGERISPLMLAWEARFSLCCLLLWAIAVALRSYLSFIRRYLGHWAMWRLARGPLCLPLKVLSFLLFSTDAIVQERLSDDDRLPARSVFGFVAPKYVPSKPVFPGHRGTGGTLGTRRVRCRPPHQMKWTRSFCWPPSLR